MASGKVVELKGRAKEAVGALNGDGKQKRTGRVAPTVGKVKQDEEKAVDKTKDAVG
jgi:uncharacterized protein YjbJ (UPF0337 family)